ncbi:uncharacterized protein LOC111443464 [Cucurbita moschata]|uniref:Uncharacterized protein LOC111443464 n=1 Tax=Cucurbita moschata TaxID=3662 RepID=A0A6J1FA15_CUCMO|nr:uncharacterized protein LOC111443464 [Cucurbita moschata]
MPFHISSVLLNPSWMTSFEQGVCSFVSFSQHILVFKFLASSFWACSAFPHYCIMKLSGLWVFFLVLQTTLLLSCFPSYLNASSTSDMALSHHHVSPNECLSDIPFNRKLKFQTDKHNSLGKKKVHPGDLKLDDYPTIDPVPSSKTSVKPGPIEHGAPLLPHMPIPPPPDQPGDYA